MRMRRKNRKYLRAREIKALRKAHGPIRKKEWARRDARMAECIKRTPEGTPLPPAAQSWIAHKLGKPSKLATPEELAALISA